MIYIYIYIMIYIYIYIHIKDIRVYIYIYIYICTHTYVYIFGADSPTTEMFSKGFQPWSCWTSIQCSASQCLGHQKIGEVAVYKTQL